MAYGWFLCGFKTRTFRPNVRYCAMDDFTPTINADGGAWGMSEALGGNALVKVRANDATLATIAGTAGFFRVTNKFVLSDSLADLTNAQRNAVNNRLLAMGYTQQEIDAVMGSTLAEWRQKTFLTLLNFICQRRLTPRWDDVLQQIVLDGAAVPCEPPSKVDAEVS